MVRFYWRSIYEDPPLSAMKILLSVLLTVPVTNAEAEPSFSALKRLKSYLRSTINQEILNGLALLAVHNDFSISAENVIDNFATVGFCSFDYLDFCIIHSISPVFMNLRRFSL